MTLEEVIKKYVELRDQRSAIKKAYEEKDAILVSAMDKVEIFLARYLSGQGLQSANVGNYTTYFSKEYKASCADWENFWGWLADQRRFNMLDKRVSITGIKEYLEEHKELPPFVNLSVEKVIRVRRV